MKRAYVEMDGNEVYVVIDQSCDRLCTMNEASKTTRRHNAEWIVECLNKWFANEQAGVSNEPITPKETADIKKLREALKQCVTQPGSFARMNLPERHEAERRFIWINQIVDDALKGVK